MWGFHTKFNKFSNTWAWLLDSIYHKTWKYLKSHFWRDNVKILPYFMQIYNGQHYKILLTGDLSILLHGVISLPDAELCDK